MSILVYIECTVLHIVPPVKEFLIPTLPIYTHSVCLPITEVCSQLTGSVSMHYCAEHGGCHGDNGSWSWYPDVIVDIVLCVVCYSNSTGISGTARIIVLWRMSYLESAIVYHVCIL